MADHQVKPLPGTHLARVDCCRCGAPVLSTPELADTARCSACWWIEVKSASIPPL